MRNFDYLQELGLTELQYHCEAAEELQVSHPDLSVKAARKALELIIEPIYLIQDIEIPERASLLELVDGEVFRDFVGNDRIIMAMHYIRKVGFNGEHGKKVTKKESYQCLFNLYNVVGAILHKLNLVKVVVPFDKSLIPNKSLSPVFLTPTISVTKQPNIDIDEIVKKAVKDTTPVQELPTNITEAETRKLYIDLMLKEAGWDVLDTEGAIQPSKACIEVEVEGMPNAEGKGYCDYVLFGSNGLPLAVIEAKRTSVSPVKGKHQAELYADCLEKRYGVKPVIYYTNGFETNIIDGLGYPPRRLYAFHTESDLELLIQKRKRHDITDFSVKDSITDRHYQKMAIKSCVNTLTPSIVEAYW